MGQASYNRNANPGFHPGHVHSTAYAQQGAGQCFGPQSFHARVHRPTKLYQGGPPPGGYLDSRGRPLFQEGFENGYDGKVRQHGCCAPAVMKWWGSALCCGLLVLLTCFLVKEHGADSGVSVPWWPEALTVPWWPEVLGGGGEPSTPQPGTAPTEAPQTQPPVVVVAPGGPGAFGAAGPAVAVPAVTVPTLPPVVPSKRCLGAVDVAGHGTMHMIAAGKNTPTDDGPDMQAQVSSAQVTPLKSGRVYFGHACSGDAYSNTDYAAMNFKGGSFSYTVNLAAADCGCVAALYLVDMHSNTNPGTCGGDYYCDANRVCGVNCDEVDIQEANKHMFKTTDHGAHDGSGKVGFPIQDNATLGGKGKYGPGGSCVDTEMPFQVKASFSPSGDSISVVVSQSGCSMDTGVKYPSLAGALEHMTPVVSYWFSPVSGDMKWFDGEVCKTYDSEQCGAAVTFSDFVFTER